MQSILIVEPSDSLRIDLEKELQKDYRIYSCSHPDEGLSLIANHHLDGLIINLALQGIDGLTFIESIAPPRPKAIITLAIFYPAAVQQRLLDLNVSYPLMSVCPVRAIANHMRYFMENIEAVVPPTAQQIIADHLRKLGVPYGGGFDDLRVGVPLYFQDPNQRMIKEFYPAVATLRGRNNWQQVEKAIRDAKEYAYAYRTDDVWKEYFPDTSKCPPNREFILHLAECLK